MYIYIYQLYVYIYIYIYHAFFFNPLTPKISLETLLTVCHTFLVMLVWRIWYWINL